jgi:hypothetical protein
MKLTKELERELINAVGKTQKLVVYKNENSIPYLLVSVRLIPFVAIITKQEVMKDDIDFPEQLELEKIERIDFFYHNGLITTYI